MPTHYTSLPMNIRSHASFIFLFILASALITRAQSSDVCPDNPADFAAIQQEANANNPSAQTALAFCYDLGRNVQPSRKDNMLWLERAAGQNYAPAQYELGRIYLYGRGVPADYAKALLWERKAAEQGDSRAQRDLAFMYERGFGVKADPTQAAEWNRKAATQGQPAAQLQLGRAYAGNANCAQAIHWYKEAAAKGESLAMHELGKLYTQKNCGANRVSAYQWFTIAARFGSEESKAEAEKLSPSLSSSQKKSVEMAVKRWIQQHPGSQKEEEDEENK